MNVLALVSRTAMVSCLSAVVSMNVALAQPAQKPFEPTVGQDGKDVIWVPTPQALVDKMLDMAKVTAADNVVDLGSGDGRTVITAAKRGATARGIEFNPKMVELSTCTAEKEGVADKANVRECRHLQDRFLEGRRGHDVPAHQPERQAAADHPRHEARHPRGLQHLRHGRLEGRRRSQS